MLRRLSRRRNDDLAELGRMCKGNKHTQRLLAGQDSIQSDNPAALVRKLCILLQEDGETPASQTSGIARVMDSQGRLLAECRSLSKGGKTLKFAADKSAFADYLMTQLERLYTEFCNNK